MPRMARTSALLSLIAFASCTSAPPAPPPRTDMSPRGAVAELMAADESFARASAKTDLIGGLSAMFAPDVAMPMPGGKFSSSASEAVAALRANPDNARSRIEWVPGRAGISADGLQGYTWGYMTLIKADGTRTPLKYLSYWTKTPAGWRVVAYKRRPGAAMNARPVEFSPTVPRQMVPPTTDVATIEGYRASLDATERAFSDEAKVIGLGVAFERYGGGDAVNMGDASDAAFVVGPKAIGQLVSGGKAAQPSTLSWAPDRTIVASSGDLGVTIGVIHESAPTDPNAPTAFPFFTVWHRASVGDAWRYVAE